jgi:hypothetical protein
LLETLFWIILALLFSDRLLVLARRRQGWRKRGSSFEVVLEMAAPWVWRCLKVELAERLLEMALQAVDKRSCREVQPRWEGIAWRLAAVAQAAA